MNPLLVQSILGHATLDMTARYTRLGLEAKRRALEEVFEKAPLRLLLEEPRTER